MALLQERETLWRSAGRRVSFMRNMPRGPTMHNRNVWFLVAVGARMLSWVIATQARQELDAAMEGRAFHFGCWTACVAAAVAIFPHTHLLSSILLTVPLVTFVEPPALARIAASTEENTYTAPALQRGDVHANDNHRAHDEGEVDFAPIPSLTKKSAQAEIKLPHDKATATARKTGPGKETGVGPLTRDQTRGRHVNLLFDPHQTPGSSSYVSSTASPLAYYAPLNKLLSTLNSCRMDADCFGTGRRCIQRRCWGFAGPVLRPFLCRPGDLCRLENLKGHFYAAGYPNGHGSFSVKVYRGNDFSTCGRGTAYEQTKHMFENDMLAAGEDVAAVRESADYTQPSPDHQPSRAQLATDSEYSWELLEDHFFTTDQGGTCLAVAASGDCPLTPGSMPFSSNSTTANAAGGNYQLFHASTAHEKTPLSLNTFDPETEMFNDWLRIDHRYACNFPPALHPQAICEITLGLVPPTMPVGTYVVCGCSGTDLNNVGALCASAEDFAVPVGRLLVIGFSANPLDTSRSKNNTWSKTNSNAVSQSIAKSSAEREKVVPLLDAAKQVSIEGQIAMTAEKYRGSASIHVSATEERELRTEKVESIQSKHVPVVDTNPKESARSPVLAAALRESTAVSARATARNPGTIYECSIGKVCSLMGFPGVALNSADFFVEFLLGQRKTCPLHQKSHKRKRIFRLPCHAYAAGSLCMVSLTATHIDDFLNCATSSGFDGASVEYGFLANLKEQQFPDRVAPVNGGVYPSGFSTPVTKHAASAVSTFFPTAKHRHEHERDSQPEVFGNFPANEGITHSQNIFSAPFPHGVSEAESKKWPFAGESLSIVETDAGSAPTQSKFFKHSSAVGVLPSDSSAVPLDPLFDTGAEAQSDSGDKFVATLCGCNSSERKDAELRCRAPVFLGYLVVYGSVPTSESIANTSVTQPNEAEDVIVENTGFREAGKRSLNSQNTGANEGQDAQSRIEIEEDDDEQIVLRASSSYPRTAAMETGAATPQNTLLFSTATTSVSAEPRSSPWRILQYITGPSANTLSDEDKNENESRRAHECKVNTDCLSGTGVCDKGKCVGFTPDKEDNRLFRCVEGYWCDIKEGQLEGVGISSKFEVIATTPSEPCGTARNLRPNESLFANSNKWTCDASSSTSCNFRAGVGYRRNKSHTVEGVRLCGCPHIDVNGDGIPCNHVRDFFVPLGRLGVQECLTNAHCVDNAFAYCIEDHCGGFLVSAAAAGVNAFTCIRNQQCTLQSIAAKSVDQALKVIPVAANFSCGAEAALDPEHVKTSALPCIADVNNDGVCDINLGINRALGTTRLCGCSGQDLGGNGRACDEAKDFDRDLGLVSNVQCIINQDCPANSICAKGECVEDDLEPYIVSMLPQNDTFAVPPLSHIDLVFNENIKFGRPGAAILIANLQQPSYKYLITLPPNAVTLKRITAPLLAPGGSGVIPRLSGAGSGAGGGGTATNIEGGGGLTAGTGFFGRGPSHTGIVSTKFAERDTLPFQHNAHRPSRKLGESFVHTTSDSRKQAAVYRKSLPEGKVDAGRAKGSAGAGDTAAPAQARSSSKQPQQQELEEREEGEDERGSHSLKKKTEQTHPPHAIVSNSSSASLLQTGGAGGWRRGGGSTSKTNAAAGSNAVPSSSNSNSNRWIIELMGQRLKIIPDRDASSLPQGDYRIGMEYGFVSDLVGNYNNGENNLRFTLAQDAGCPHLYVTGFTTENGNCNGLYVPTDPMNEQASWQGGERNAFFIYWKRESREGGRPATQDGNWIIDTNLEDSSFLAFADLHAHADKKQGRSKALPPSGLWHKWTGSSRVRQDYIQFHCTQQPDRFAASLIAIDPPIGAALQLSATTLLPLHPITLVFNKPMNYGHWAAIKLTPRETRRRRSGTVSKESLRSDFHEEGAKENVWYADSEAGMRGNAIRIYNKPAPEVLPSLSSSLSGHAGTAQTYSPTSKDALSHPSDTSPRLTTERINANNHETRLSSRLLQKRLHEPMQRLPLLGSYSSNQHLALVAATTRPDTETFIAAASPRSAAEAKANETAGVVELHVQHSLLPGEMYDFSVQLGALTDYSYNPWGPLERGIIIFHTTGGRCRTALNEENVVISLRESPSSRKHTSGKMGSSRRQSSVRSTSKEGGSEDADLEAEHEQQQQYVNYAEAYVVLDVDGTPVVFSEATYSPRASEEHKHRTATDRGEKQRHNGVSSSFFGGFTNGEAQDGTQVRVRCRTGYSVHASARGLLMAEETLLRCSDGRWRGEQQLPKCFRNCGVYPKLGGAYQMAGDVGGDGIEGEVIDVQCTDTAELLSASGRQAVLCSGGKWDALLVKCGATCPPLGPNLGSKYEVKQIDTSTEGARRQQGSGRLSEPAIAGRSARKDEEKALAPETGEAKEGDVRKISCAPGAHSASSWRDRSSSKTALTDEEAEIEDRAATEELRCGRDGWEQLSLQCFSDCPTEQLAALLGQHGPGLEVAAESFKDGRHSDVREFACAIGFAAVGERFSKLFTRCDDGRWLPLSTRPAAEEEVQATTAPAASTKSKYGALEPGVSRRSPTEIIPRPVCVPRCSPLQLPAAAYVVTSLSDVREIDGSTRQQARVQCAAAAVAVGSEAREQTLRCSTAGIWELLTLLCKASCKPPLLQLGDRYQMQDEKEMDFDRSKTRGKQADSQLRFSPPEAEQGDGRESAEKHYPHGTERLIGCAPGSAADGGAGFSAATQKIVCDDGLWQSAYRGMMRTNLRNTKEQEGSRMEADMTSIELQCRKGCGVPVLPHGVQPLLLSPRAVMLQRWQHGTNLLVGCTSGFSAIQPTMTTVATSSANADATNADLALEEASQHVETLMCKDGRWEGLAHRQQQTSSKQTILSEAISGREGSTARQTFRPSVMRRQLQQDVEAELLGGDTAASDIKRENLYLTLQCRRDCAAADMKSLAQQQHYEVQQTSSSRPSPATIRDAVSHSLRHGEAQRVACQRNFEILSGRKFEDAAVAISCNHGKLLLPHLICGLPSCTDGIQNGDETGVDCGGSICSLCLVCSDGIQNGDETGVDCGGRCPPCQSCAFPPAGTAAVHLPIGLHHVIAVRIPPFQADKNSSRRVGRVNSGSLGSSSETSEAGEEVVFDEYRSFEDTLQYVRSQFPRGMSKKPMLPPGSSLHIQCESEATASGPAAIRRLAVMRCMPLGQWLWAADAAKTAGSFPSVNAKAAAEAPLQPQLICSPPTCSDGIRNADETGVDCGGSCSKKCSSCFNGVKDEEEEDIDCGGRYCEPCSSCSPRLLKPFLLNSSTAFAVLRRGAVVGTFAAAASGISSSSIPSAPVLDQGMAKGMMHRLLTAHGQKLQIKCNPLASAAFSFPKRGVYFSSDKSSSSLAAATAGTYYALQQEYQFHGMKQPLPLTVHCRHGIWTTPSVAAASALALTKTAGTLRRQTSTSSSSNSSGANQAHQQDSWLARAALEARQALDAFRQSCVTYRRAAGEGSGLSSSNNFHTALEEFDLSSSSHVPERSGVAIGQRFTNRPVSNDTRHKATEQLYWAHPHFAVFGVPDFRVKINSPAVSSERGETENAEGDACITRLIETFRASLRGECGALAFGSSSLKISSFCSNSCRRGLEVAIEAATQAANPQTMPSSENSSSVDGCNSPQASGRARRIAELLQELINVWCQQRNGTYCFAEAEASFAFVQELYDLIHSGAYYESELAAACPADSCFRSNVRHIVLLAQLSSWLEIHKPVSGSSSGAAATIQTSAHTLRRSPFHGSGNTARRLWQQQQETPSEETLLQHGEMGTTGQQHQLQSQHYSHIPDEHKSDFRRGNNFLSSGGESVKSELLTNVLEAEYSATDETTKLRSKQPFDVDARDFTEGSYPVAQVGERKEGEEHSAAAAATGAPHNLAGGSEDSQNISKGRRLLAVMGRTAAANDMEWNEGGTRHFLSDITHLPEIMNLLCIRVEGQSCAPEVLRIGMDNPVLQSPAADTEESQRICMRNPCILEVVRKFGQTLMDAADASIFISKPAPQEGQQRRRSSSRHSSNGSHNVHTYHGSNAKGTAAHSGSRLTLQQLQHSHIDGSFSGVEDEEEKQRIVQSGLGKKTGAPAAAAGPTPSGLETSFVQYQLTVFPNQRFSLIQPRDVVLGMLMKYWGRTFCHRNVHGALCGSLIFPSKEFAMLSEESRSTYPPWTPQVERLLQHCKCPTLFIGDGDCDLTCFSAECEWDRGDCLASELAFPVYRYLVNQLGKELNELCNPFNAAFTCGHNGRSRRDRSGQAEGHIQNKPQSAADRHCAAYFSSKHTEPAAPKPALRDHMLKPCGITALKVCRRVQSLYKYAPFPSFDAARRCWNN